MSAKKTIRQTTTFENKTWNNQKGACSLNFTLRVDVQTEMKDFAELLENALVDVRKELSIRFPKT